MSRSIETVFVVDDQVDIRMIASRALRLGRAWTVLEFASGEACLEALASTTPDLILLDVMMPGLDGTSTLVRLRSAGCEAPVILMTARVGARRRAEYEDAGASGLIAKPFDPLTLVDEIDALLGVATEARARPLASEDGDDEDEDLDALFRRQLASRMDELAGCFESQPPPEAARLEAKRIAHSLAGSAGSFGYHALGEIAGRLEARLEGSGGARAWAQIEETRRELERAVAALSSEE